MAELAERVDRDGARAVRLPRQASCAKPSPEADYLVDNPNRRCPDIARRAAQLGYEPSVAIDEGLRRSLIWYHHNRRGGGGLMRISVIGTGYVGLVSAACFAEIGHDCICVDVDPRKVERINRGRGADPRARAARVCWRGTSARGCARRPTWRAAVLDADITFIAVGTPFDGQRIDLTLRPRGGTPDRRGAARQGRLRTSWWSRARWSPARPTRSSSRSWSALRASAPARLRRRHEPRVPDRRRRRSTTSCGPTASCIGGTRRAHHRRAARGVCAVRATRRPRDQQQDGRDDQVRVELGAGDA